MAWEVHVGSSVAIIHVMWILILHMQGSSDGPDPMATFSLSSTFIYSVHSSGPASDSGLKQGGQGLGSARG